MKISETLRDLWKYKPWQSSDAHFGWTRVIGGLACLTVLFGVLFLGSAVVGGSTASTGALITVTLVAITAAVMASVGLQALAEKRLRPATYRRVGLVAWLEPNGRPCGSSWRAAEGPRAAARGGIRRGEEGGRNEVLPLRPRDHGSRLRHGAQAAVPVVSLGVSLDDTGVLAPERPSQSVLDAHHRRRDACDHPPIPA